MAKPTLVAVYDAGWSTATNPKGVNVTMATGDILVAVAGYSNYQGASQDLSMSQVGGTTITWNEEQQNKVIGYCGTAIFTATAPASQTVEVRVSVVTGGGSELIGLTVYRFSGSSGIGNSIKANATTGEVSQTLTASGANSAVVQVMTDWNATGGTTRTPQTISGATFTETVWYAPDGNQWGAIVGYYDDVGAAGSKTVGWSSPTDWKWTYIAVEVLGGVTLDQKSYRYFNDDGSESGSTAMAAQNTDVTVAPGGVFRIRFGIQATGDPAAKQFRLEYDNVGGSNWKQVP